MGKFPRFVKYEVRHQRAIHSQHYISLQSKEKGKARLEYIAQSETRHHGYRCGATMRMFRPGCLVSALCEVMHENVHSICNYWVGEGLQISVLREN